MSATNRRGRGRSVGGRSRRAGHCPACRRVAFACVVTALCLWAPAVAAQEAATTLEELWTSKKLTLGDTVYVRNMLGRRVAGNVSDLSSSAIEVVSERGTVVFAEDEVSEIVRRDPVSNGVLNGILTAGGTYALLCTGGESANCFKYLPSIGLNFMAIGAFVGWSMDYFMHETVYRKPGSARLTVSPVVTHEGAGAGMSLSW